MNFALTDEQELLTEAARGALSRVKTVEAAREALDGGELPDLWPTAVEAGWPGLLVGEERGGAGLGAIDAMLVFAELGPRAGGRAAARATCRRRCCSTRRARGVEPLASGERRAAFVAGQAAVGDRGGVDRRPARTGCGARPRR